MFSFAVAVAEKTTNQPTKMAARVLSLRESSQKVLKMMQKETVILRRVQPVYTATGGLLPKPEQIRFPVLKVLCVALPFLYTGATLSKNAAAFLEENDIFVPEDDDD